MAFEQLARGQRVKTTSFIQVHDFSLLEMYSLHVIAIFYCICEFQQCLLKDLRFKFVFIWIRYGVALFAATVGKCTEYSQITENYCFEITNSTVKRRNNNNNKKPTLFSDQDIILLQAEVDKDI